MDVWAEVRQLVADFQQLQRSNIALRLSERNCIELVTTLHDLGLIELFFTLDGKEYVTPQCLEKEIKNELLACQGRSNVVNMQKMLNVDLHHVEAKMSEILKHDRSITLLGGELITRAYLEALCEEINDNLQEVGQIEVAELSKTFCLPNAFLLEIIESAMDSKINGELDKSGSGAIYTESYVRRYKSRIRGIFSAITGPVPIGQIIIDGHFQERLFFAVLHSLISAGQLKGKLRGQRDKSVYIPSIYISLQSKWMRSFFFSNGYLEFDALKRVGVDKPASYISNHFSDESGQSIEILCSCAVGDLILNELDGAVEDLKTSKNGWIDVSTYLPSLCTLDDIELLCQKKYGSSTDLLIFGKFLATPQLLQDCIELFSSDIKEKARQIASSHPSKISEIAQKIAVGESLSSKIGRKGKKVKTNPSFYDERNMEYSIKFMSQNEAARMLSDRLLECDEFSELIITRIENSLQEAFMKEAMLNISAVSKSKEQASLALRKKHVLIQQRIESLWNTAKLFSHGIDHFEGGYFTQLSKYLLRTLGSDLVNIILVYVAEDIGIECYEQNLTTTKDRSVVISKLPPHSKGSLSSLNESLNEKDLINFFEAFEKVCLHNYCGIMLKKLDKKRERQLIYTHQLNLKKKLSDESDYAVCLHLTVVMLFHQNTGSIIHIPGKFVPDMISFLSNHVPDKIYKQLLKCQQLVTSHWKVQTKVSLDNESGLSPTTIEGSNTQPQSEGTDKCAETPSVVDDIEAALIELLNELKHLVV